MNRSVPFGACACAVLVLSLHASARGTVPQLHASVATPACTMSVRGPERIVLANGWHVIMNGTSMATSGDELLIVGTPIHAFGPGDADVMDGIVGVLRSAAGAISVVPSPVPGEEPRRLQTVAAKDGGWHIFLATGSQRGIEVDSAEVWYGHFDGRTWTRIEHVTRVYRAMLALRFASNPVETDHGVGFVYLFDRSFERMSNARGNQGAVMLFRRDDGWVHDTLHTWEVPQSVQLAVREDRLFAFVAQSYFAHQRSHGPALFAAEYDGGWSTPRLLYDPSPDYVADLIRATGDMHSGSIALRRARKGLDQDVRSLEWATLDDSGTLPPPLPVSALIDMGAPGVALADVGAVFLVRDGDSRERLKVFAVTADEVAREVGALDVPLMSLTTIAAGLPDGRIIALTGGPDPTPHANPPYASYLTEIAVRCPLDRG